MSILPVLGFRALVSKLNRAGFVHITTKGSHYIFRHTITGLTTTVPMHGNKDIGRGLLGKILKEAGISTEDFLKI